MTQNITKCMVIYAWDLRRKCTLSGLHAVDNQTIRLCKTNGYNLWFIGQSAIATLRLRHWYSWQSSVYTISDCFQVVLRSHQILCASTTRRYFHISYSISQTQPNIQQLALGQCRVHWAVLRPERRQLLAVGDAFWRAVCNRTF